MALSDPFESTYQGAYKAGSSIGELGRGLETAAGEVAKPIAEGKKLDANLQMLKNMGLFSDQEPSIDDWKKSFEDQTGTNITGVKSISGQPVDPKTISNLFEYMGLEKPKSKGLIFNSDEAQKMGASTNLSTGETILAPKRPEKTPMETVIEQMAAARAIDDAKKSGQIPEDYEYAGKAGMKESSFTRGEKEDQFAQKEWDKIVKANDIQTASSRSTLGMAANANLRADRAMATLNNPLLTYQDAQNIVADIAGIYAGGAPTDVGMSHSQYNTVQSKIANIQQFLTGRPTDAVPSQIKEHLKGVLGDLKKVNKDSIKNHLDYTEKAQSKVISKYKDEWENMKSTLLPEEDDMGTQVAQVSGVAPKSIGTDYSNMTTDQLKARLAQIKGK